MRKSPKRVGGNKHFIGQTLRQESPSEDYSSCFFPAQGGKMEAVAFG